MPAHLYLLLFYEDSLSGRESNVTDGMRMTERSFSRAISSMSSSPLVLLLYLVGLERVCCQSTARGTGVRKTCPAVVILQVTIEGFSSSFDINHSMTATGQQRVKCVRVCLLLVWLVLFAHHFWPSASMSSLSAKYEPTVPQAPVRRLHHNAHSACVGPASLKCTSLTHRSSRLKNQ